MALIGVAAVCVLTLSHVGIYYVGKSAGTPVESAPPEKGRIVAHNDNAPKTQKTDPEPPVTKSPRQQAGKSKSRDKPKGKKRKSVKTKPKDSVAAVPAKPTKPANKKRKAARTAKAETLPDSLPLPAHERANKKAVVLAPFSAKPNAVKLSLHGGDTVLSPGSGFRISRHRDEKAKGTWVIEKFGRGTEPLPVAEISLTGKNLKFAWTFGRKKSEIDLLRFCVLEVSQVGTSSFHLLLKAKLRSAIRLDTLQEMHPPKFN